MNGTRRLAAIVLSLACLGLLIIAAGCKKDAPPTVAPPPPGPPAPEVAARSQAPAAGDLTVQGQKVFADNKCSNCHSINGQGGRGAPDLTRVGGERDSAWIVAHVRNPKAHNPNSRMPSFEGKISDADLAALGAYLASLK